MIPQVDNNHVAEGAALVTSRYSSAQVVQGIIKSLMTKIQFVETQFWAMIAGVQLVNHPMAGGPWSVLDQLGAIVGASRNGLDDADYVALIKLQAKVNRSRGTPEDVLQLGELMAAPGKPAYLEMQPASFYLVTLALALNYPQFVALLRQVRAAGVYGCLIYTTWPTGNDLIMASTTDATAGQGVLGSTTTPSLGGLLSSAVGL